MAAFRVQDRAGRRLDEIYVYTRDTWGEEQASRYIRGLFERFDEIASRKIPWRAIPAEFGVDGFYCRYGHHYIYWRLLSDGVVGIVTVLHERMHQLDRFGEDLPKSADKADARGTSLGRQNRSFIHAVNLDAFWAGSGLAALAWNS